MNLLVRFSRLERDLKQKRQLLESQREKMKKVKQQAFEDKENLVHAQIDIHVYAHM